MGSLSGAIWFTVTISPGTQPISISFKKSSSLEKEVILADFPGFISESFLVIPVDYNMRKGILFICFLFSNVETMIQFNYQTPVHIQRIRDLKAFLQELILAEKHRPGPLSFVFCTDDYLLQINQQYLNHHDYTDIITFNLSEEKGLVSGELYISIERVKENALKFKVPFASELYRVMFHGILHLCGYNDKTRAQSTQMRQKEDHYLRLFNRRST